MRRRREREGTVDESPPTHGAGTEQLLAWSESTATSTLPLSRSTCYKYSSATTHKLTAHDSSVHAVLMTIMPACIIQDQQVPPCTVFCWIYILLRWLVYFSLFLQYLWRSKSSIYQTRCKLKLKSFDEKHISCNKLLLFHTVLVKSDVWLESDFEYHVSDVMLMQISKHIV